MKKILSICMLLILTISFSYAQDPGGGDFGGRGGRGARGGAQTTGTPEQRAQVSLDDILSSFTLNKENRAKTLAILVAQNKSLDSLTATLGPTVDIATLQTTARTLQTKKTAIMQANEALFMALLTDKQRKLYESAIKTRPANRGFGQPLGSGNEGARGGEGGGRGGAGRGFGGG